MNEEYYVGQIFDRMYPDTAANWANKNKKRILEIDHVDGVRRFQIQEDRKPTEEEIKQARVAELKAQLDSTDYRIIKCSECSLAGVDLPYDIAELHAQRQAIRDEINELED